MITYTKCTVFKITKLLNFLNIFTAIKILLDLFGFYTDQTGRFSILFYILELAKIPNLSMPENLIMTSPYVYICMFFLFWLNFRQILSMNIFSVAMRDQHAQPELSNIQKPDIILQSSDGPICFGLGTLFTGFWR